MATKPKKNTRLLTLRPRARVLMAEREIRTVSELKRRLEDLGVEISLPQLGRVIDGKADHWNKQVIQGLVTVFDCEFGDLWMVERPTLSTKVVQLKSRRTAGVIPK